MLSVALSNTADEGWNVTLITQLDPEAKLDPQVLVCVKSALFEPVIAIPEIETAEDNWFDTVMGCCAAMPTTWLPKDKLLAERENTPVTPPPVLCPPV
jgi:hypothetical protein